VASSGNFLPTFRDNLSVSSSSVKNPKRKHITLVRGLHREECGRWQVLSKVVSANRVDAGVWVLIFEGGGGG